MTLTAAVFTVDVTRAGVLLGGVLLVTALIFRSDLEDDTGTVGEFLDWLEASDVEISVGPGRATAFFVGSTVLFVVLALAALLRRDWLTPRLQVVHDLTAAPVRAAALLVLMLPVLGILFYGALMTGDDTADSTTESLTWNETVAVLFIAVSNLGMQFLTLGAGGRWGASVGYDSERGDSGSDADWFRLGELVDQENAWALWFSIPAMLVTLGCLTWWILRQSRPHRPGGSLLVWSGLSVVVFVSLLRMSSVHGRGDVEATDFVGHDEGTVSFLAGIPLADALLLWLVALLLAAVAALAGGTIDVRDVGRRLQSMSATASASGPSSPPPTAPPMAPPNAGRPPVGQPQAGPQPYAPPRDGSPAPEPPAEG